MADSLTMREAQKREPIEEIKLKLAQDNSPLAPIVQDAMRLALLCKEHYYYMLFHSHLDGGLPKGDYLVSTFQEESLRAKVLKAFESDRTWSLTPFGGSLQHMEEQLQNIQQQMNETPPRESKLWDAKIGIDHVLMNIREKVETLITELENPSSRLVRAAEVVSSEFPIRQVRQDGRIFIGHGRSPIWRELKDFLQEKLGLQTDEFNRESTPGKTTVARLCEMLDAASFAFLIMTAEDEHADKTFHARENVLHEIGLFQGRLTFEKAIVLLEQGCTEFSNIHGLTAIRFPKGNIMAQSEEIRGVLAREGIRSPTER